MRKIEKQNKCTKESNQKPVAGKSPVDDTKGNRSQITGGYVHDLVCKRCEIRAMKMKM